MDGQRRKPLISTEDEEAITSEPHGGCLLNLLGNLLGIIFFVFIIMFLLRACGGDRDSGKTPKDSVPKISSYDVTISLDYEKVPLTTNSPINVCIDDLVIGRQDAGTKETYIVTLDEGTHKFYLKNDGVYSTTKLDFNVSEQHTYFQFGTKTRLTFGMEVWKDFDDSDASASTIKSDTVPALEGEWIDTCLAQWEDYSLNVVLPPELYDVTHFYEYPGTRSDIGFLENSLILSASAELIVNDSSVYTVYELSGEDMQQTIDFMFDLTCEALYEQAKEVCSDFELQVSKPAFENCTNGNTVWKVCTYTGSNKSDDIDLAISNFFYMNDTLRASITILCITSDGTSDSSELERFSTWVDVLKSSLEIERSVQ